MLGERAKVELAVLKFVADAEINDSSKCEAAFMVIDGADASTVTKFVLDRQDSR